MGTYMASAECKPTTGSGVEAPRQGEGRAHSHESGLRGHAEAEGFLAFERQSDKFASLSVFCNLNRSYCDTTALEIWTSRYS